MKRAHLLALLLLQASLKNMKGVKQEEDAVKEHEHEKMKLILKTNRSLHKERIKRKKDKNGDRV